MQETPQAVFIAHWRDHDLAHAKEAELTQYRHDHVRFVFQCYNLKGR